MCSFHAIYSRDFDFNDSSDKPLLDQLLVEELMQRRLFRKSLKYPDQNYDKKLNDSVKRVTDIQTKLGITREQRAGILNKIDGNVAQLAISLDEKLEKMPAEMKRQYEEEVKYQAMRDQRPPVNILPPRDKLEALLNVGGTMTGNLTGEKISEVTEEVTKEVGEILEEEAETKKQELPGGIDVGS